MKKPVFILFLFCLILLSVSCYERKKKTEWEEITIGNYSCKFPPDFRLIKEQGIDSYVGKIKGDSFYFSFDSGEFSGGLETSEGYLKHGIWHFYAGNKYTHKFIEEGKSYNLDELPKLEVLNLRPAKQEDSIIGKDCDYIAKCKYDSLVYDYPIYFPETAKIHHFKIDSSNNKYRQIAYAKNPKKGGKGQTHLFYQNDSTNSAISLSAHNLTKEQQDLALKIFETMRYNPQK